MPSPTLTRGTQGGTAQSTDPAGGQSQAPVITVPFVRASNQHREPFLDRNVLMTAADQDQGSISLPAYGYLRSILILVQGSGGTGAAATYVEDAPFSALKNIFLQEPNGAPICQFNSGYELYLVDKYNGYRAYCEPKLTGGYTAPTTGNFAFMLRIPIELNERDALGSLPNQNAAATFQLRFAVSALATVFAVNPTTIPTLRIRAWAEEWDQPDLSTDGLTNQTTPPAMNTTQYHSVQSYPVNVGANQIRLTRMGNYIRNIGFIYRVPGRAAAEAQWPDLTTLFLDTRPLDFIQRDVWRTQHYERYGFPWAASNALDTANNQDNGVYWYDFTHEFDGEAGHENRDLWLPTLGSTRFEISGTFGAAGTLTVITNDVSVAGNVFM